MSRETAYPAYGAAAVNVYTPARMPAPADLPAEAPQRQKARTVRVRARAAVAPVAVIGFFAVIALLILVVFGYVQLYEATSQNAKLASQLETLKEENAALSNQYEGQVDLGYIEKVAVSELGMQKVLADQSVYVDLSSASDQGVVVAQQRNAGFLRRAVDSIRDSVKDLLEYLH